MRSRLRTSLALSLLSCAVAAARSAGASPVGPFSWQTRAEVGPTAAGIEGAAGAVIGAKVYVSHGHTRPDDLAELRVYDPPSDSWSFGPAPGIARSELAGAAYHDKLYAIGGRFAGFGVLSTVEVYDPASATWSLGPPLSQARAGLCAVVIGERIHAIGGRTGEGPSSGTPLASHEIFDGTAWTAGAPLLTAVMDVYACVALSGKIYVFGGLSAGGMTGLTQIYDDSAGTWSYGAPMPTARSNAIAGVLDCHPVVIGGVASAQGGNLSVVEIYHPDTDSWTTGPPKPTAASEMAASMPGYANAIHAIGSGIRGQSLRVHEVLVGTAAGCGAPSGTPSCSITGPYASPCRDVLIDGATASDPEGDPIDYQWSSSNPEVSLSPVSGTLQGGTSVPRPVPPTTATLNPAVPPCNVTATIVLELADGQGHVSSCDTEVLFNDDIAPSITGVPADQQVSCDAVPAPASPAASDNCGAPTLDLRESQTPGACLDRYTILRRWTAEDSCGNQASRTQTIQVQDAEAPSLQGVPASVTVACDAVPAPPTVTASDNCDPDPAVSFQQAQTPGACPDAYTILRSWTAEDRCGNEETRTQSVAVQDLEGPVLQGVPADVTVQCDAVPPVPVVTASDNCDPAPAVSFQQTQTPGSCPDAYTILRSWTAEDRCGNRETRVQRITVQDTVAPVLHGVPADATVECDAVPPPPTVTASDNCDPAPAVSFQETQVPGGCPDAYTILRTWTAIDRCGNLTVRSQRIEVQDTTPPVPSAILWPTAPRPPASAASPHSVCSAPASRSFEVRCSATDNCDPAPDLSAVLRVTWHEVEVRGGPCVTRVEDVPVACGEIVEIDLVARVCPARAPRPPRSAVSVNSAGVKVITGEEVVLRVTATDRCGNGATAGYDPAREPSPVCDEVLDDGTCCPAIGRPPDPGCRVPVCGGSP